MKYWHTGLLMVGVVLGPALTLAQTSPPPAIPVPTPQNSPQTVPAGTAPIAGAEVMSDKNRSGPDGWVFAPVNRTESFSGSSPSENSGKNQRTDVTQTAPAPYSSRPMPAGEDPGTPASTVPSGPGSRDVPQSQH